MQTVFNVLVECINQRNFGKFSMVMGVIEGDWLKVAKNPETFERSLDILRDAKEMNTRMNVQYYRDFDLPVHPQFVIERLQSLRFSNSN